MSEGKRSIPPARPSRIPPAEQQPVKFLLVEDDELIVRAVLRQIRPYATVFTADTVNQAWTIFQLHQHTLEVIYLDGILGDKNTLNLLARIRTSGYQKRIVSITTHTNMRDLMMPEPVATDESGEPLPRCDEHIPKNNIIGHMIASLNQHSPDV